VATEEIVIGDNDTLAAIVAESIKADVLVLFSDIDGLYTADPHKCDDAKLIKCVETIDEDIEMLAGGKGTELGTGGMVTKITAAKICVKCGCDMIITNGNNPTSLYDIVEGKQIGTKFIGKK
jgi:glutamate 5-kinase